ncbi:MULTISPECIES: hypothetical protein [Candidatus Nitrosocaldus]|nr:MULTISPECIES: hypothetical protein [Candidatus Nitrosocaldus]
MVMVVMARAISMMIMSMLRVMIRMGMMSKYTHSTMHGGRDLYGCSKQGAVGIGYVSNGSSSNSSSYCVCIGGGIASWW